MLTHRTHRQVQGILSSDDDDADSCFTTSDSDDDEHASADCPRTAHAHQESADDGCGAPASPRWLCDLPLGSPETLSAYGSSDEDEADVLERLEGSMQHGLEGSMDLSFTMSPRMLTLLSSQKLLRVRGESQSAHEPATDKLTPTGTNTAEHTSLQSCSFPSHRAVHGHADGGGGGKAEEKKEEAMYFVKDKLFYAPPLPLRPSPAMMIYECQSSFSAWIKLPCLMCEVNDDDNMKSFSGQPCSSIGAYAQRFPSFSDFRGGEGGGEVLRGKREYYF